MEKRPLNSMTAMSYLMAAMLVMSAVAHLGSAVVCIGSDGRIDIEPSECTCCASAATHNGDAKGLTPTDADCSDCMNVPLDVPPLKPDAPQLSAADLNSEEHTLTTTPDGWREVVSAIRANHSDRRRQSLLLLSTVVLLT